MGYWNHESNLFHITFPFSSCWVAYKRLMASRDSHRLQYSYQDVDFNATSLLEAISFPSKLIKAMALGT